MMFNFFKNRRLRRIAERRALMNKALDWLEANPQHHIEGSYATDADGFKISPGNPRACNFCALGRIAHEAGINEEYTSIPLQKLLKDFGGRDATTIITTINDDGLRFGEMNTRLKMIRNFVNEPVEGETV